MRWTGNQVGVGQPTGVQGGVDLFQQVVLSDGRPHAVIPADYPGMGNRLAAYRSQSIMSA